MGAAGTTPGLTPVRALVTGAQGFVGRHLCALLRASGDDVIAIDRVNGPDITDADAVTTTFVEHRPDVVFHLAGQADVAASWESPTTTFRINAEGTMNVLAAARAAGVGRVLATISADVYGLVTPGDLPLTEDAPLQPVSPYAASKAAADIVCRQAHLGHGQDVIRARSFNHLGPGQSDRFVAGAIASRIVAAERAGERSIPVGDLSARRDFTDVRDVVLAYRLLMDRGTAGAVYNVCSGVDHSVQDVADALVTMASSPVTLEPDPDLMRPVDLPVLRGDASRLRADTGWEPTRTLHETLADLFADMRERADTGTTR